ATKAWKSSLWGRWTASAGPFVEFEVRLPSGILLPDDKNIELTLWANGMGRGCPMAVRRTADPPDLAGQCSIIVNSPEYVMSLRLSRFYEGYWRLPIFRYASPDPVFTPGSVSNLPARRPVRRSYRRCRMASTTSAILSG